MEAISSMCLKRPTFCRSDVMLFQILFFFFQNVIAAIIETVLQFLMHLFICIYIASFQW